MFGEEAKQILRSTEKSLQLTLGAASRESIAVRSARAPGGTGFVEEFRMLRHKTCPACHSSRRLEFHSATYDHLCPRCGHDEKATALWSSSEKKGDVKSDAMLPILVAFLMAVVFAAFVFWVALGHSPG
jgi:hypothetical protein